MLPLAVDIQNHASFQWLGKAVSFYLIAGLGQNGLPVSDEEEVQAVLNRNLVRFPFDITKATAMVLAGESGADRLLWGKILYSDKKSAQMQVQLFLIDIKERTQKQLPLVKGNFVDIYRLQEELLKARSVMAVAGGERREIVMPQLNLSLPEYEKFIKSLLLNDADKKLELLLPAAGKRQPFRLRQFRTGEGFPGKARPGRLPLRIWSWWPIRLSSRTRRSSCWPWPIFTPATPTRR